VQVKSHASFRNLTSVTSELIETHALTVKQHCCFNVQSPAAAKLVGYDVKDPVAITAMLLLLPEKRRYPKYGDFTTIEDLVARLQAAMTTC
jgi:hypothetical protein